MQRQKFLQNSALFTAMLASGQASAFAQWKNGKRKRVALVGTGIRGSSFWRKNLVDNYAEEVEFVGLCDKNAGRLVYVKDFIPYQRGKYTAAEQEELHANEMSFGKEEIPTEFHEIVIHENFNPDFERVKVLKYRYGHGGGDKRMLDYLFVNPDAADPLSHMAGTRDGALSILIGVTARKSIAEGRVVRLDELVAGIWELGN